MTYSALASVPFLHLLGPFLVPLIILLIIWELIIKGFALWRAAHNNHKAWFILILILNTVGILPLVYLIWFSKGTGTPSNPPAPISSTPEA